MAFEGVVSAEEYAVASGHSSADGIGSILARALSYIARFTSAGVVLMFDPDADSPHFEHHAAQAVALLTGIGVRVVVLVGEVSGDAAGTASQGAGGLRVAEQLREHDCAAALVAGEDVIDSAGGRPPETLGLPRPGSDTVRALLQARVVPVVATESQTEPGSVAAVAETLCSSLRPEKVIALSSAWDGRHSLGADDDLAYMSVDEAAQYPREAAGGDVVHFGLRCVRAGANAFHVLDRRPHQVLAELLTDAGAGLMIATI